MASLLKVSEAASLAVHSMMLLGATGATRSTRQMADQLQVSEAHLAKVLQRLAQAGLVESIRGPHGGFRLAQAADKISLADVYEAVDGRLTPPGCLLQQPICNGHCCLLGKALQQVEELHQQLREMTLAAACQDVPALAE